MIQAKQRVVRPAGHGDRLTSDFTRFMQTVTVYLPYARLLLPVVGLLLGAAAVVGLFVGVERLAVNDRDAAHRAVLARAAALDRAALASGSALACLDAGAGDTVETACEKAVFRSAQSAAAAVAYMDARLKLLSEAAALARQGDGSILTALAATRRAVGIDRFGVAAQVLAIRDGCTAAKCAAFALVDDPGVLKSNLRAQVYDQYVSRYAGSWNEIAPVAKPPAVAQSAIVPPIASIAPRRSGGPLPAPIKPGEKWDFPSSASIPAVSIMGKEPRLPPGANASAQAPPEKRSKAAAKRGAPIPLGPAPAQAPPAPAR